ncbi:MAG: glycosyltransferase family 4 protein [Phycisphaerales bacterium]
MSTPASVKSVLLLSPAFMADRRHKRVHGTEVFNFLFVRQLVSAGYRVTLCAEPAWRDGFAEHLAGVPRAGVGDRGPGLTTVYGLPLKKPLPASLSVLPRLLAMPAHDLLIVGNVARGILPAVWALQKAGKARRTVVIAHQNPKEKFLRGLRRIDCEIQAVSGPVGARIRRLSDVPVWVSYGVLNGDLFFPREGGFAARAPGPLRFGVVGQLETPWKGAHLALEAWAMLAKPLRAELHLCAYANPPRVDDASIVFHPWKRVEEVGAFMRTLDVLIVPSTSSETFSQVMVQGMLTGMPILAYNLDVLTEKLAPPPGGGLVFSTAAELAGCMQRLVNEPAEIERMGAIARRTALERYVWRLSAFTERYLA